MTYKNLRRLAEIRKVVLGSASPRRVELLKETGIQFRQVISDLVEDNNDEGNPYELAKKLAEAKALSVAKIVKSDEVVVGADTVVALNGQSLGKPADKNDASRILQGLSGKKHTVCTALAIAAEKKNFGLTIRTD